MEISLSKKWNLSVEVYMFFQINWNLYAQLYTVISLKVEIYMYINAWLFPTI